MATLPKELSNPNDRTIIGESILVSGRLDGDEDLTVRGRVEGNINLTKTLVIESSGVVKADVSVRNCIVSGVVVGNVTATESVELMQEGRMVGDIKAPRVIIVDGASFRGRVDMGDLEAPRPSGERPRVQPAPSAPRPPAAKPTAPAQKPPSGEASRPTPPGVKAAPPLPPAAALANAKRKVIVKRKK
jgi:cytoskeletal protein CcmA (bactofilin family)